MAAAKKLETGKRSTPKSSISGTGNTGIDLTGKEICNIIKACSASGVSKFSLGQLQVQFGAYEIADQPTHETASVGEIPAVGKSDPTEPHQLQLTAMDENVLKEQFYTQQLIDDPEGFETHICDGFLENVRVEDEAVGSR